MKNNIVRKPNPQLPSITATQARILRAAIDRGVVVSGSFAQKALYPESRPFNDIDIISKNPKITAKYIQSKLKLPTRTQIGKHGKYAIKYKGNVLADVVPIKYYEKYIDKRGGIPIRNIGGVKVLREDVLYQEKMKAIKYGNQKIRNKAIRDALFLQK